MISAIPVLWKVVIGIVFIILGLLCFWRALKRKGVSTLVKLSVFVMTMLSFYFGVLLGVFLK